jgi:hypothetical protein
MRYLLDTNIISNVTKPSPAKSLLAWMAEQNDDDLYLLVAGFQPRRAGWNLTGPSKIRSCNVYAAAQ